MKKIKVIDFLKDCYFNDSVMDEFKSIHPKQLISTEIPVPVWKIHYSYNTARGNPKEAVKYILDNENAWDRVDHVFIRYVEEQNEKFPERKISNVEILDVTFMGNVYLSFE